jgi:putative DNA-invertase from lambdoid prophage Rac
MKILTDSIGAQIINIRAVGYTRGSTDEQKNTLVAQREEIEAYARYRQIEIACTFEDSGESAVSVPFLERPKVREMLSFMQPQGINTIIITKLDRGFRDAVDVLTTIDELRQHGIRLHLLDIGLDPSNPVGELIITIMAGISKFECKRRAERQVASFKAMKASGQRCGTVPYGWKTAPSDRISKTGRKADNLVPDEAEQAILARIRTGDLSHLSCNETARTLNRLGITAKNGGEWKSGTIHNLRKKS